MVEIIALLFRQILGKKQHELLFDINFFFHCFFNVATHWVLIEVKVCILAYKCQHCFHHHSRKSFHQFYATFFFSYFKIFSCAAEKTLFHTYFAFEITHFNWKHETFIHFMQQHIINIWSFYVLLSSVTPLSYCNVNNFKSNLLQFRKIISFFFIIKRKQLSFVSHSRVQWTFDGWKMFQWKTKHEKWEFKMFSLTEM